VNHFVEWTAESLAEVLVTHQYSIGIFAVHVAEKDHPYRSRRLCKETTLLASVPLHRIIFPTNPTNLVSYQ